MAKVGVGVGILVYKDGKFLLGRRHDDADKADSELHGEGTWTMPGGGLHFGETPEECAIREVKEETGIDIKSIKVITFQNDKVEDAQFITIGLFSDDFEGEPKVMEPDEIVEWQWFDIDNPPTPLFFPSERILKQFKDKTFYQQF